MAVLFLCLISAAGSNLRSRTGSIFRSRITRRSEGTTGRSSQHHQIIRRSQRHRKIIRIVPNIYALLQLLRRYILNTALDCHSTGRSPNHRKIIRHHHSTGNTKRSAGATRSPQTAGARPEAPEPPDHWKSEATRKIMIAINQIENGADRNPWKQQTAGNRMPNRKITDRPEEP